MNLNSQFIAATLPTTVSAFSMLSVLLMDDNQLTGALPDEISALTALQYVVKLSPMFSCTLTLTQ